MSFKLLQRFRRKKPETNFEDVKCANCETQFTGKFCPNCGQAVKDYDKPFSFVFYNFLGDFFAFDTRFFRTIISLLLKPGFLSKEYIEGRRVRYAPPFRIFVFVSFVLFLMLQNYTNRGLTTVLDSDIQKNNAKLDSILAVSGDSIASVLVSEMSEEELKVTDSILSDYGLSDTTGAENLDFKLNLATFKDTRDLRQGLAKYANAVEKKLETEEDPEQRAVMREHIRLCRSPEQAMAKILEYISWAFFLLLPLFALILKLIYIRRGQNYMRHLIFSIHIHAFIYIVMMVVVGMYISIPKNIETLTSILVFAVPVYTVIAMKRFYAQSIGKTILKFFVASFVYNILFLSIVIAAILNALKLV